MSYPIIITLIDVNVNCKHDINEIEYLNCLSVNEVSAGHFVKNVEIARKNIFFAKSLEKTFRICYNTGEF